MSFEQESAAWAFDAYLGKRNMLANILLAELVDLTQQSWTG
jgi:hypothetical protein